MSEQILSLCPLAGAAWYYSPKDEVVAAAKHDGSTEATWRHLPVACWALLELVDEDDADVSRVVVAVVPGSGIEETVDRELCQPAAALDCLSPAGACRGHVEAIAQAIRKPRLVKAGAA